MTHLAHLSPIRDHLGRPLKDLRISVMDRCNFRCIYCMPEEKFHSGFNFLKSSERLSFDEIFRVTKLFTDLGVSKIRITGGEPLLRVNLSELIGDLSTLEKIEDIALTTNGVYNGKRRQGGCADGKTLADGCGGVAHCIQVIGAVTHFRIKFTHLSDATGVICGLVELAYSQSRKYTPQELRQLMVAIRRWGKN